MAMSAKNIAMYKSKNSPMSFALDVTSSCNFKCLHCFNDSGVRQPDELSNEELVEVARQIASFNPLSVCMCGGEPTLRGNLLEIIEIISPHAGAVNMVSNGFTMTQEKASALKDAGLSTLQISLDGVNAIQHDTFRGYAGAFKKAVAAIEFGIKNGLEVDTAFSPTKANFRSIEKYLEFCYQLGVSSVRVMPLIPMGRGRAIEHLLLTPNEYLELQLSLCFHEKMQTYKGMRIEWGDPLDHFTRMPNNAKAGISTYIMEIRPNGDLAVSPYIPLSVGNVRVHSLREYWDAGYNKIWGNPQVVKYIRQIENIYDLSYLESESNGSDNFRIELL